MGVRTLVALAEDSGPIPSPHIVAFNHPYLQFQRIRYFSPSWMTGTCCANIHVGETSLHHKIKINLIKEIKRKRKKDLMRVGVSLRSIAFA